MKKILVLILFILLLSCTKTSVIEEVNKIELKYYTLNSVKPGTLLKENLQNKKAVLFSYPEYVKQSYDLIKFMVSIMVKNVDTTVFFPNLPSFQNDVPFLETIKTENPHLGFIEFIDLLYFFKSKDIQVSDNLINDDMLLILSPESKYKEVEAQTLKIFKEEEILRIEMVGTDLNKTMFKIINELPVSKKLSSVKKMDNNEVIMILMDEVNKYTMVKPIALYTIDNYLTSPTEFVNENRSVFKSLHLKNMNNYLSQVILDKHKRYGE